MHNSKRLPMPKKKFTVSPWLHMDCLCVFNRSWERKPNQARLSPSDSCQCNRPLTYVQNALGLRASQLKARVPQRHVQCPCEPRRAHVQNVSSTAPPILFYVAGPGETPGVSRVDSPPTNWTKTSSRLLDAPRNAPPTTIKEQPRVGSLSARRPAKLRQCLHSASHSNNSRTRFV